MTSSGEQGQQPCPSHVHGQALQQGKLDQPVSTASQHELAWNSHLPVALTQKDTTPNLIRTEPCQPKD